MHARTSHGRIAYDSLTELRKHLLITMPRQEATDLNTGRFLSNVFLGIVELSSLFLILNLFGEISIALISLMHRVLPTPAPSTVLLHCVLVAELAVDV
jgi:hypothetical protein